MKQHKIKIILTILLVSLIGCSKEECLFTGEDNYISSFQLKQGDLTFNANITGGDIIVTVPENLSLEGAVATVTLSENATITPTPSTIDRWEDEQFFTVTSYNGKSNSYTYRIVRNSISKDGDIVLLTQADVEALAELNLNEINGNLIIGAAAGLDSVYTLAPLAGLKSVKYSLIINATYAGENLAGLEDIELLGELQVRSNMRLRSLSFPKLISVMTDLTVSQSWIRTLDFPELVNIDKGLQITTSDSLVSMAFPKLNNIVQNMTVQGSWGVNKLEAVEFPALTKVGGDINITNWREVTKVNMPNLESTVALSVTSLPKNESLVIPKLKSTLGNLSISSNTILTDLDLSLLRFIDGDFRFENNNAIEHLNGLRTLEEATGEIFISNLAALKNIDGLKSLTTIGKRLYLSNWPVLEDAKLTGISNIGSVGGEIIISQIPFSHFSGLALTRTGTLSLYGNGVTSIEEIDVRNLEIETALNIQNITTPFTLKGKDICNYNLNISGSSLNLEGFKEVKAFTYNLSANQGATQSAGIEKVNGDLTISVYGFDNFAMPKLTEVGGRMSLSASNGVKTATFPLLQSIGVANFEVGFLESFTLPKLETVNGNCTVRTGAYNADNLADLQMPALKTVNGILELAGYSSYYGNSKLTNFDGFLTVASVAGVVINNNAALTDYTGLKNAIASFAATEWKVSDNNYNPTYQDMVDGNYIKP